MKFKCALEIGNTCNENATKMSSINDKNNTASIEIDEKDAGIMGLSQDKSKAEKYNEFFISNYYII